MTAGRVLAALFGLDCPCVTLWAAIGTLAASALFLGLGPPAALKRVAGNPPERIRLVRRYSSEDVAGYLGDPGGKARTLYRLQLQWDLLFLLVYGWGLAFVVDGTFVRSFADTGLVRWALLAPAVAAVADLVEDVLLLSVVSREPGPDERFGVRVTIASIFTLVKWWLVLATLLLIVAGLIILAFFGPASVG